MHVNIVYDYYYIHTTIQCHHIITKLYYYLLYNKCVYINRMYDIYIIHYYNRGSGGEQKEMRNQRVVAARADSFTTALRGVYAVIK